MTEVTKKLFNKAEDVVEESLEGFVAANPNLRLLKGYRVVVRKGIISEADASSNNVRITSGGGSGHEPLFAGFVGSGMLDAAVAGSIFASPPPSAFLASLQTLRCSAGILQFVFNYTGDRLNVGLGVDRAEQKGIGPIRVVVLGEDSALTSADRTAGRRGLAGSLMVLKMAGGMSLAGLALNEIADQSIAASANMGTMGVSLSSCSHPGSGHIFHLGQHEMELGLGVHGEPGIKRMNLVSAKECVDLMLSHLTSPKSSTSLQLKSGNSVAILFNNLGALTNLEMNIMTRETLIWLNKKSIKVERIYSGGLMTSLEMQGISISLLRLDNLPFDALKYLDAPTDCNAWPKGMKPDADVDGFCLMDRVELPWMSLEVQNDTKSQKEAEAYQHLPKLNEDETKLFGSVISAVCQRIIEAEPDLTRFDAAAGDGDCGTTLRKGAQNILDELNSGHLPTNIPSAAFNQISNLWESNTGGSSGPIFAMLFGGFGNSLSSGLTFPDWCKGLKLGTESIMRYGQAKPNDRTLVDALHGGVDLLNETGKPTDFKGIVEAIEGGANGTAGMKAHAGRASYVSDENFALPDPGAMAVAYGARAAYTAYLDQK